MTIFKFLAAHKLLTSLIYGGLITTAGGSAIFASLYNRTSSGTYTESLHQDSSYEAKDIDSVNEEAEFVPNVTVNVDEEMITDKLEPVPAE